MKVYQKILLAVELDPSCDTLTTKKAKALADEFGAELYLVHAIEHMSSYGAAYGVAAGADIEEMLLENASDSMKKLASELALADDRQVIKVGPARTIILEEADRIGADLVVVGSHGRHGIRLLLGSTANAVLHGAACDVLAVRLKED
ncbi:MAG: universal stress protein [Gammaproteobacteria bacterium]|nr:universal stress protein [Gammaproteobacteria bacterium]